MYSGNFKSSAKKKKRKSDSLRRDDECDPHRDMISMAAEKVWSQAHNSTRV